MSGSVPAPTLIPRPRPRPRPSTRAPPQELAETRTEASQLVELLDLRQGGLTATLEGGFPELRATAWQSLQSVQAAVQALTPQMTENKKRVEDLLREALLLQVCLFIYLFSFFGGDPIDGAPTLENATVIQFVFVLEPALCACGACRLRWIRALAPTCWSACCPSASSSTKRESAGRCEGRGANANRIQIGNEWRAGSRSKRHSDEE
jgi:hypothetical protein